MNKYSFSLKNILFKLIDNDFDSWIIKLCIIKLLIINFSNFLSKLVLNKQKAITRTAVKIFKILLITEEEGKNHCFRKKVN
jgi:hypothetical protein